MAMRLLRLQIQDLYGSISKDIPLKKDLNLLVGINGSGKTSVLNIIDWLLQPNIARLATTSYKRLALSFEHDNVQYTIEAIQTPTQYEVFVRGSNGFNPSRFHVVLTKNPALIDDDDERQALEEQYSRLGPDKTEIPIWEFIAALPKPVVISLDRTISAEAEDVYFFETPVLRAKPRPRTRTPLSKVKEVASTRYAAYRTQVIRLNDELKDNIIMSSLRDPLTLQTRRRQTQAINPRALSELETRLRRQFGSAMAESALAKQLQRYFSSAREIIREAGSPVNHNPMMLGIFQSQYRQLEDMLQAFDTFERKVEAAYAHLRLYLETVNAFLKQSGKRIYFDEPTNQLTFQFLNAIDKPPRRALENLSSGERQVLILFTFLAFVAEEHTVFIVDEPELSLHPQWQSEFLDAFLALKPKNTQILLATHSPEIVADHKSACILLRP